jgi:hypothetical protein
LLAIGALEHFLSSSFDVFDPRLNRSGRFWFSAGTAAEDDRYFSPDSVAAM